MRIMERENNKNYLFASLSFLPPYSHSNAECGISQNENDLRTWNNSALGGHNFSVSGEN